MFDRVVNPTRFHEWSINVCEVIYKVKTILELWFINVLLMLVLKSRDILVSDRNYGCL